jgi:hypothetical protein
MEPGIKVMRYTLAASFLLPIALFAQNRHYVDFVPSAPTGGCNISQNVRYVTSGGNAGKMYGCTTSNVWVQVSGTGGGGGSGTVTNTGTLTNNQLVGGNGGVDIKPVNVTGDATTSGGLTLTLATVNSNVGACGDASHISQPIVNAKGLVTGCTPIAISPYTGTFQATVAVQTTDSSTSGGVNLSGKTSGGAMLAVADVAGTAIVYVLPTSVPMSFPASLQITGTTTCPTLLAGSPATCYATAWQ